MSALRIDNLSLQAGAFRVQDLSLTVADGEYFVLMGMTGAGKSLLLKAVCGLMAVSAGRIAIADRDVTALPPRDRRVGYVPQDAGLFPHLSVLSNIIFPLTIRGLRKKQAVENIQGIVKSLSIEYLLSRSTVNLSGGEQQKVALARALACQPQLLVLDEPVCALDEPTRRDTCRELRRVQKEFGVATLHVCHSRDEAQQVSDRIGIMADGRLVATGTLMELQDDQQPEAARKLLGSAN